MAKQTANKSPKGWRITYNAKFTLTFCLIAVILLNLNVFTGGFVNHHLGLSPSVRFFEFYRLVTYIVCHGSYEHLFSNLLFLIILGPILEEKYGAKQLLWMTIITALATGLVNSLLFSTGIIGASGIVFMFIILSSIVNLRNKEIPFTFLLVVLVYLGGEFIHSFKADGVSQFGHIFGGICGAVFGFLGIRK
jgi:membrane associated rhomboid family serine protease